MVEAAHEGRKPSLAIKTTATFAGMDGPAQRPVFPEVQLLEVAAASDTQGAAGNAADAGGPNLLGHAHLDQVTCCAAFHQPQDTARDQPAHRPPHRRMAETSATREPGNGESDPKLSLEAAMAEEMRIDGAVDRGQAQTRHKQVLDLLAHLFSVGFFVFHGFDPELRFEATKKKRNS
jgi:hypothetical protein